MRYLFLSVVALIAAACTSAGGGPSPSPAPSVSPAPSATPAAADPDTLLFRVESVGGFVAPNSELTRTPFQSIYADGRVFEQGMVSEIYPGPLVPPILESRLTPDGLAIVQQSIDAADLADANYPPHGIADAPDTQVTALTGGKVVTLTIGVASPDASLTPEEATMRASVGALISQLANLPALVGDQNLSAAQPYTPDAMRLVLTVGLKPDDGMDAAPLVWPLDTPIATFGAPTSFGDARCGAVDGANGKSLWAVVSNAKQNQYFEEAGVVYLPAARPLFPDEPVSCDNGTG